MLDDDVRDLERLVRASPHDGALSRRWLAALRRAGRVAPDSLDPIERVPNPGLARGDLVLVARRARARETMRWLPEMDALVGDVLRIERVARDGLTALVEGPSFFPGLSRDDPVIGRSLGFASLIPLVSASSR